MTDGAGFLARLEKRFPTMSPEEKLDKLVEYEKRLAALRREGLSEAEAAAALEAELLSLPPAAETEDYGRISRPKKPLLTGTLYALALAALLAAAALFTRLFS